MRPAAPAADLGAVHAVAVVVHQLGEARPAGARFELGVGAEQLGAAGRAAVHAVVLGENVPAAERRLGPGLAQDLVPLSRELLPPLPLRPGDLGHLSASMWWSAHGSAPQRSSAIVGESSASACQKAAWPSASAIPQRRPSRRCGCPWNRRSRPRWSLIRSA